MGFVVRRKKIATISTCMEKHTHGFDYYQKMPRHNIYQGHQVYVYMFIFGFPPIISFVSSLMHSISVNLLSH